MKTFLITTPIAASLLISTAALAAGTTATGTIKTVDKKSDAITLDDGSVYTLSEGFEAETYAPGEKVTITFKTKNGKMIATSIKKSR